MHHGNQGRELRCKIQRTLKARGGIGQGCPRVHSGFFRALCVGLSLKQWVTTNVFNYDEREQRWLLVEHHSSPVLFPAVPPKVEQE